MRHFAFSIMLLLSSIGLLAQCNLPATTVYGSSYALRTSADWVYTYSQQWAVGPDAPYIWNYDYQTDYINSTQIGQQTLGWASPGYTASTWRNSSVDFFGFGEYWTEAYHAAYDACANIWEPPYSNSWYPYTTAYLWANQPTISSSQNPIIPGRLLIGVANFNSDLTTSGVLTANTGGAPETPYWFIASSPNPAQVTLSGNGNSATVSLVPNTPPGCAATWVQYRVGNLTAPEETIAVVGIRQSLESRQDIAVNQYIFPPCSPGFCGHTVGYQTQVEWNLTDTCGNQISQTQFHEEFPSGLTYLYPGANWRFPTANQWCSSTTWTDQIGETCLDTQGCIPTPLVPQNPLTTVNVYQGHQSIWAGYVSSSPNSCVWSTSFLGSPSYDSHDELIWQGTQIHYQDHGDFTQP